MKYNPFDPKNCLYAGLATAYNALEPETLTCDGEASRSEIAAKQREYHRWIKGLNYAIGREIDAMAIFDWELSRQDYEREQKKPVPPDDFTLPNIEDIRKANNKYAPTGLVGDPQ